MTKKIAKLFHFWIIMAIFVNCKPQTSEPGHSFRLFDNTPNRDLSVAVENEDTIRIKQLLKNKKLDINLKDPKLGRTLLTLAAGSDKVEATRVLLEEGADVSSRDFNDVTALHDVTQYIPFRKNSYEIIKLLIEYKADVNALSRGKGANNGYFYVPLAGAVRDVKCAKLLLENGASPYIKFNDNYIVWNALLSHFIDDNIFTAKYMIIEKEMPVPKVILKINNKSFNIFDLLNVPDFPKNLEKVNTRDEIVKYLKDNNFPSKGAYEEAK